MDVLAGLNTQLKESTKVLAQALNALTTEAKSSREQILNELLKKFPELLSSLEDLTATLKKVFEVKLVPKKSEAKK